MFCLEINVCDKKEKRVIEAMCHMHGYNPDSGMTKEEFVRWYICEMICQTVKSYEGEKAASKAREMKHTEIDGEDLVT